MGYIRLDDDGLGTTATALDPATGQSCSAPERRIRVMNEPTPADLVTIDVQHSHYPKRVVRITRTTYDAYQRMKQAAEADGIDPKALKIVSGFRSVAEQRVLWNRGLARRNGDAKENVKWVARPGSSPHHTGRAIDIWLGTGISSKNVAPMRRTDAYRWLVCNAARFGFSPYAREPWHWEYNPPNGGTTASSVATVATQGAAATTVAPGAPPLVRRESAAFGETLYLRIPLGSESPAKPLTGMFIPTGFRPSAAVDVILYLHGHKRIAGHTGTESIDATWNAAKHREFPLREQLAAARRNVILVAPTLGPRSESGRLTRAGGLDTYLREVFAALAAYGPFLRAASRPALRHLILACHSGGGLPMRSLATGNDLAARNVRECWAFDSMYFTGDESKWAAWARNRTSARLFVYYQRTTATRSKALAKLAVPNVTVAQSPAKNHFYVPIEHWVARIQGAPFLDILP